MIELVLAAERLLEAGDLDHAERLFAQVVEADPQNAIAVAGLAEVALARGDGPTAMVLARRALGIDPEDVAARRLVERLGATPMAAPATTPEATPEPAPEPAPEPTPEPTSEPVLARRSLLDRIRAFFRRR